MTVAERSRALVQERLARLEQEFGSTLVDQTTFSVGAGAYERAVERSREGQVDVHAFVHNESGDVLLSEDDGSWTIPGGRTQEAERPAHAAVRVVREAAGVDCSIRDAVRATICGVRNSDDPEAETVYGLSVVFDAEIERAVSMTSSIDDHGSTSPADDERGTTDSASTGESASTATSPSSDDAASSGVSAFADDELDDSVRWDQREEATVAEFV